MSTLLCPLFIVQFRHGHTAMTPETLKCEAIDRSTPGCRFFRERNHPANINNPEAQFFGGHTLPVSSFGNCVGSTG
jgi:hypothetical protein